MEEVIRYARSKMSEFCCGYTPKMSTEIQLINRAFPLYHQWGIAGVKIDFMDERRSADGQMVSRHHKMCS